MRNREIIKEALIFPVRKYKHFMLVTLLFLFVELLQELLIHYNYSEYTMVIILIVHTVLPLLVIGINLQIIYHIVNQNRGLPNISIKKSIKEATKDFIIESYYFGLTLAITAILSIPTGIYHNTYDVYFFLKELSMEVDEVNVIQVMGSLPDLVLNNYITSITISIIIFVVTFIILFSFCSISKIDFEIHQNYKQSFNTKRMVKIIAKIGIIKYLGFLFLIIILCIIMANLLYLLNYAPFIGSIISSVMESFSLFFFIYSFTLLYPDELIPK